MLPLRVLHLASFSGNIGDNANHMGFRPWFAAQVGREVTWTNCEIREFYWKERAFDADFVTMANSYDALVIGGGNYFELWVENSPTGTSIAISSEDFDKIRVPIFFNALGVDSGQGVPEKSKQNFTRFLSKLLSSDQYLVSVRNDGAVDTLREEISSEFSDAVHQIPDGGFFMQLPSKPSSCLLKPDTPYIGINIANDMADVRFDGFKKGPDSSKAFADEFAKTLIQVSKNHPDYHFVFFPHIFRDLDIIFQVILMLDDRIRRTRVVVAPYSSGNSAAHEIFSIYKSCKLTLSMRFHANVCSMGLGVPCIGLGCYRQIHKLYEELGKSNDCVDVSAPGFLVPLTERISECLLSTKQPHVQIQNKVLAQRAAFEPVLQSWAGSNALLRRPG